MASSSGDKTIKIWKIESAECIQTLTGHTNKINQITYSPDGSYLASTSENLGSKTDTSEDKTIKIWEVASGNCVKTLEGHAKDVNYVNFSPDGKFLTSGSGDKTIKIWEVKTTKCIKTLKGHEDGISSVSYSPDGKYIISSSFDDTIRFWKASTGELLATTFNLKDDEWLIYTPEGFFAGSEWATKKLSASSKWHENRKH